MFTDADKAQIEAHGLTVEQVEAQLERFRKGFAPVRLDRPCTVGDGILQIAESEHAGLIALHDQAAAAGRMMKFVPASGAASRMFRDLVSFYQQADAQAELTPELVRFFTLLHSFAFYDALKECMAAHGQDIDSVLAAQDYHQVLKYLLTTDGLHYAHIPKALIPFHKDPGATRTAVAEQLLEAKATIQDQRHTARVHLTVSAQYLQAIKTAVQQMQTDPECGDTRFEVTYSTQSPSTDTIAVDLGNQPFRDEVGRLVFRPGGHGALLQNLNALDADIVFIKNIDNVVPSPQLDEQVLYKKLLGGLLLQKQQRVFELIGKLSQAKVSADTVEEATSFVEQDLRMTVPEEIATKPSSEQTQSLRGLLHRPIRICGVVKNVGEPGGGPFWVGEKTGGMTKQLVEAVQIRSADTEQEHILAAATHFNPVDMVCGIRDHQGHPFDLTQFSDAESGIITGKSHLGHELKALEWPGLWNGGMAHWITLFVEVPLSTFAPVKTVNDLLRPAHQNP